MINDSVGLVAFYNVENLFLPDPPSVHKLDPTPSGLYNWDQFKYQNKISKIANVFQLITDSEGVAPLIIGLAEIHGRKPLEDLVAQKPLENYSIVHYDSPDKRGIGVALLYDSAKIQLISSEPLSCNFTSDHDNGSAGRDILHCTFTYSGEIINLFVVHLPSKRDGDINSEKRQHIIAALSQTLEVISARGEAIIICGDFNANPDEDMVTELLYDSGGNKILSNPFLEIYDNNNFSTFHRQNGLLFDQLILSPEFYRTDFPLKVNHAKVFTHEKLIQRDGKITGRPARTFAGSRYIGGYSDHFPVLIRFADKQKIR